MKSKIFYLTAFLAGVGSLLMIIAGQGDEPLGVWNRHGPMSKGQVFEYIILVCGVILLAPCVDFLVKRKRRADRSKWEQQFMDELETGQAKRVPPKNRKDKNA